MSFPGDRDVPNDKDDPGDSFELPGTDSNSSVTSNETLKLFRVLCNEAQEGLNRGRALTYARLIESMVLVAIDEYKRGEIRESKKADIMEIIKSLGAVERVYSPLDCDMYIFAFEAYRDVFEPLSVPFECRYHNRPYARCRTLMEMGVTFDWLVKKPDDSWYWRRSRRGLYVLLQKFDLTSQELPFARGVRCECDFDVNGIPLSLVH